MTQQARKTTQRGSPAHATITTRKANLPPLIAYYPILLSAHGRGEYKMESDKERSPPQPEEPVNSIEDDSSVTEEQWKAMMDVTMAIYDFRESE